MVIQANVWNIHYNPDIWGPTDPDVFEPERLESTGIKMVLFMFSHLCRFSAERKAKLHPLAWIPFGAGPRNCIGLRFALMEAKIVLAKMIKRFRLVPCEQTAVPMEIYDTQLESIAPKDGVTIKVELRE